MSAVVLQELTGDQAREQFGKKGRWAILPLGSTEYHGPRGPLGTDSDVAWEVGKRVAAAMDGLLLPVMPYGDSGFHKDYDGTIHIEREIMKRLIVAIAASVHRQGARNLLLLLGHWGNQEAALEAKAELDAEDSGMRLEAARVFDPAMPDIRRLDGLFGGESWAGHGGAVEVSVALYARPGADLPSPGQVVAKSPPPGERNFASLGWEGLPEAASAERGKKAVEIAAAAIVRHLRNPAPS